MAPCWEAEETMNPLTAEARRAVRTVVDLLDGDQAVSRCTGIGPGTPQGEDRA